MPMTGVSGTLQGRGRTHKAAGLAAAWRRQSLEAYSDLIVPFGRMVETDDFCTVISVPSEISTPT
ncbi:hypothetical protein LMG28688_00059 [Paraburkholderia caffeinitolerans]|uniref:Uncharacterized protein n=1 Tax=Paraburkholderia caffeinitolerans TaxID=1723730 RepID=A0A6J5FCR7_9BURK|nr:hypothetical protein LMG28688_00059 [Paraburkholderia caffeinitolerans]